MLNNNDVAPSTGAFFQPFSRFARVEEVLAEDFLRLTRVLDDLTRRYNLPDHSDVNRERYPWSVGRLGTPELYAARMWEYPFALLSAELQPGMECADIGCGMTAFTVYLQQVANCHVVGVDPDLFESGIRYKGHGVSREYVRRTGLKVVQSGMESIPFQTGTFDRVFCLSVIEHLAPQVARLGVQEMARILKPGGRAILTIDVNLLSELSRPLDMVWDSGLIPLGEVDIRWPSRRFGIFDGGSEPADVFGLTLIKDDYPVETAYSGTGGDPNPPVLPATRIPPLRFRAVQRSPRPLWREAASRVKRACFLLWKG
ncbi:MAG: class I SAM-dependent methyltransferase [Syntrophorhabdales bacterium]|jgi:SAM-dependent methyltransferase